VNGAWAWVGLVLTSRVSHTLLHSASMPTSKFPSSPTSNVTHIHNGEQLTILLLATNRSPGTVTIGQSSSTTYAVDGLFALHYDIRPGASTRLC
jgi:hypothetical protein